MSKRTVQWFKLTIHEGHATRLDVESGGTLVDKLSDPVWEFWTSQDRVNTVSLNKKEISQLHNLAVTKSKKHENNLIARVRGYKNGSLPISLLDKLSRLFQPYSQRVRHFELLKGVLMGIAKKLLYPGTKK